MSEPQTYSTYRPPMDVVVADGHQQRTTKAIDYLMSLLKLTVIPGHHVLGLIHSYDDCHVQESFTFYIFFIVTLMLLDE